MDIRNRLNLGLLGFVVVLLAVVLWPKAPPQPPTPTLIDSSAIKLISILRQGYEPTLLERDSSGWQLPQFKLPARQSLIEQILKLPNSESHASYPISEMKLGAIGLENPALCLQLDQHKLCFGNRNPLDQLRYLQIDDQVHMIYDTLSHQLSGEAKDYLSLRLLPEQAKIDQLQLSGLQLQRSENGWQVTPESHHTSADAPQILIDAWKTASALNISHYQSDEPEEWFTLTLQDGETLRFALISSEPELILARPDLGIQYHLSEGSLQQLTRLNESE